MKKRILALLLAAFAVVSLAVFPALAATGYIIGDVNGDGKITSADVTILRRYVTGDLSADFHIDKRCADTNRDGNITPADVTMLRMVLSGMAEFPGDTQKESVDLNLYQIVVPAEYTKYEEYAAALLADYVKDHFDISLPVVTDAEKETAHEFLIGSTARTESAVDVQPDSAEYLLWADGGKILLQGERHWIGAAVGALTYQYMEDGEVVVSEIPAEAVSAPYTPLPATGVILMIGDGMGFNHIAAAEWRMGRRDPSWDGFNAGDMPNQGSVMTYSLDFSTLATTGMFQRVVTDSAASGTAMSTGWKTQNSYVGLDIFGKRLKSVREVADELGYKTGILTTDEAYKATPAAFSAHNSSRHNYDEIAAEQQELLESGHLTYLKGEAGDELLASTREVLDVISTDSPGYFAMIEEAYTDRYSHNNAPFMDIVGAVVRLDSAVEYAMTFAAAHPDAVLIVTADHETGALTDHGLVTNGGNHTNLNVGIFAMGYGTEMFNDTVIDNVQIGRFIAFVYGEEDFGGVYGLEMDNEY